MRKTDLIAMILTGSLLAVTWNGFSQPYIDLLNIHYVNSPNPGLINREKTKIKLNNFSVQATLPFQFKNKTDALILSPVFEIWRPEIPSANLGFNKQYGLALPVSFLKTLSNPDWSLISTLIIKRAGYSLSENDNWQIGAAAIINFKANENLKYKLGLYVNKEFFGLFVMPLVGIDWEISKKTNLFGLLPGNLILEHRLSGKIYVGGSFRAITSSYRIDPGYFRVDENRLGVFLDYYLTKNIVLNTEFGHSILRKVRTGLKDKNRTDWNVNDNVFFKVSAAYRIRFR